jgi:hypothetical protein
MPPGAGRTNAPKRTSRKGSRVSKATQDRAKTINRPKTGGSPLNRRAQVPPPGTAVATVRKAATARKIASRRRDESKRPARNLQRRATQSGGTPEGRASAPKRRTTSVSPAKRTLKRATGAARPSAPKRRTTKLNPRRGRR